MERLIIFISNFWCFLWHWLILVIPVRFLCPNEPSWLGADWYALLAGYEWGVPLTVFGFISFVMASQYIEFNGFPLISLLRGRGLTKSFNTDMEDFLDGLAESKEKPKKEEQSEEYGAKPETSGAESEESGAKSQPKGIPAKSDEDKKEGAVKVLPPSL